MTQKWFGRDFAPLTKEKLPWTEQWEKMSMRFIHSIYIQSTVMPLPQSAGEGPLQPDADDGADVPGMMGE